MNSQKAPTNYVSEKESRTYNYHWPK